METQVASRGNPPFAHTVKSVASSAINILNGVDHVNGANGGNGAVNKAASPPDANRLRPMRSTPPQSSYTLPRLSQASGSVPPYQQEGPVNGSQGKIAILEPPSVRKASSQAAAAPPPSSQQGFPSPGRDSNRESSKFTEDFSRLTHGIQQAVPEAVRRVVRDNWEKALTGSDFHQAFVTNAIIHHASGSIIRRAIRDFGATMVADAKAELIDHFTSQILDDVGDRIIEKASDDLLDKALAKRLQTIDARSLINALARAERLGYDDQDVIDDHNERVRTVNYAPYASQSSTSPYLPQQGHSEPQSPYEAEAPAAAPPPAAPAALAGILAQSPQELQCGLCWRKFTDPAPFHYHVKKQLCTKEPPNPNGFPFACPSCGAGFVTGMGAQYHQNNKVCGNHGTAPATPKDGGRKTSGSPITLSSGANSPNREAAPPRTQLPPLPSAQSTPVARVNPPVSASGSGSASKSTDDPYGHLTPEQMTALAEDLHQAELSYKPRFAEIEAIEDPVLRKSRLELLNNSFTTKQSLVRKKYGVRLRARRTRAEIESERQRMGMKVAGPDMNANGTPLAKRRRTGNRADSATPTYVAAPSEAVAPPSQPSPVRRIQVSDMLGGLGESSATAALTDPTTNMSPSASQPAPQPPRDSPSQSPSAKRSLASYQDSGYRVSTHTPATSGFTPANAPRAARTEDAEPVRRSPLPSARPIVSVPSQKVEDHKKDGDDSSSDSDSNEDIPAVIPATRSKSKTPQKGTQG